MGLVEAPNLLEAAGSGTRTGRIGKNTLLHAAGKMTLMLLPTLGAAADAGVWGRLVGWQMLAGQGACYTAAPTICIYFAFIKALGDAVVV